MKLLTKAALCAAVLACPAVASAASYVQYDFTATGSGSTAFRGSSPSTNDYFSQMQFSFIAPATQSVFDTRGSVFTWNIMGGGTLAGRISAGSDGIDLSEGYGTLSGSSLNANICNTSTSLYTPTLGGPGDSCGTVSFASTDLRTFNTMFSGTITALAFTVFSRDSDAPAGLVFASPGVPEPSTWALMLAGFGLTGYALRRRSRVAFA